MRANYKEVNVGEKQFKVTRINPLVGNYLVAKIMLIVTPLLSSINLSEEETKKLKETQSVSEMIALVDFDKIDFSKILNQMSREDFIQIQEDCLYCVQHNFPSGYDNVLNKNGTFTLELTMKECVSLITEVIKFNVSDFFPGALQK